MHVLAERQVLAGAHRDAEASVAEAVEIARDTGLRERVAWLGGVPARIAAIEGDEERCRALTGDVPDVGRVATNTSSLPVMRLGMATGRADRVVGLHFFNPVPVLPLVEVVTSLHTSAATTAAVEDFATRTLGKTVIRSQDRAGFVVNALLVPYLLSAIRMAESGFATAAGIDTGMELGCAHPMGPLRLADLIGLDTVASIAEALYDEFKEPLYAPPPLLLRMVEAGLLGRKTGRGFHRYDQD
ncbi:3-hydroxyacyl-CoA dehydrogenase family protein [Streptomyces sp. 15-116A]|uniref:3-hydroxyacyl-CoA dehydrogenase family protein n=1 Tax=Streptomyces sp. 15-116A TaxID=2259035 RepID=UPI0021B2F219|nr:3-hydroxyacyl-CoA dehydrogenase family protein [Streptomyces sp. 15-116A]